MMNENAKKVIEAALSCLGYPYVFGMWGRKCTPAVRRQYAGYNPSHKRAIEGNRFGIDFSLVAADYLQFRPLLIRP